MKARCGNCRAIADYPMVQWSWVRYKGSCRDKMVCPECRREAEIEGCNILSPTMVWAYAEQEKYSIQSPPGSLVQA